MARKRKKKRPDYLINDDFNFDMNNDDDFNRFLENADLVYQPGVYAPRKKPKVKKKRKPVHMEMGDATTVYHTKKENKIMENGKTIEDFQKANFDKNKPRTKHLVPGSDNKTDGHDKTPPAPKGYKWVTKRNQTTHETVPDYSEYDIFTDFHGNFFLKKVGNTYTCWIEPIKYEAYNKKGDPAKSIEDNTPICKNTWVDPSGSKSFRLARVAAYFAKHNITEDVTYHPHIYDDVKMGCGGLKFWNILGEGNDDGKPHIIAHAGESIVIDTGAMKVHKDDGQDLTKITSFGSTFPPLEGHQLNQINFYPTQGDGCDVHVSYVPRIR